MKKFLIFLVTIIVTVCAGLTTYYFLRNDESIVVNTKELFCNNGDVISVKDLNISVRKKSKKTKYTYSVQADEAEEQTENVIYDSVNGYFVAQHGGEATLVVKTSNKKFPEFKVLVHVGDGGEEYPYYLDSQADLAKIGTIYDLGAYYTMIADIRLNADFAPIGYNPETKEEQAFTGYFVGNGYTVSGLNLTLSDAYTSAGLFAKLSNATVTGLNIKNATISGEYAYAGALAGVVSNSVVSKIAVNNVNISNSLANSVNGGLAGVVDGNATVSMSKVAQTTISSTGNQAIVGGLVGKLDQSKVIVSYADAVLEAEDVATVGGLIGLYNINTNAGSIQQSYSISTSEYQNFGAFVGEVNEVEGFDSNTSLLKFFVGNMAVTNGASVVNVYDDVFFTTFYNEDLSYYLIKSFADVNAMKSNTEYVFYAVSYTNRTLWNDIIWDIKENELPELNLVEVDLPSISSEYLNKNLLETPINSKEQFLSIFAQDIIDSNYRLDTDIELDDVWVPVALINSIFNGNGHTITGLNLTDSNTDEIGLFTVVDNSAVKDLILDNVTINANKAYTGALAGRVISNNEYTSSNIEGVVVNYASSVISGTYAGGLVAILDNNASIKNCVVNNYVVDENSHVANLGGLVGGVVSGTINNAQVEANLFASQNVGGLVAENAGTINNSKLSVVIATSADSEYVGGVTGKNNGYVEMVEALINITVNNNANVVYVGGVAGVNNGSIVNAKLLAQGILVADSANNVYIGGVAGANNLVINNCQCLMDQIGSYIQDKNVYVGGVAAINSNGASQISKCVVASDIYGNIVAGVVAVMDNTNAKVDQVLVGKLNAENGTVARNVIKGDKFVAGIAYSLTGTVTNIQCVSTITGATANTNSSLLVLIFPNGAAVDNVTVDSALDGYGKFYRETWKDYDNSAKTPYYNIYDDVAFAGKMTNVVINADTARAYGKTLITADINQGIFGTSAYKTSGNTNNVTELTTAEFNSYINFSKKDYELSYNWEVLQFIHVNITYTVEFDSSVWDMSQGSGLSLNFIAELA